MRRFGKSDDGSDQQIAVLGYGSLLAHPGEWLGHNMQRLIRWESPFGVEYLGVSERHGGAPTLVRSDHHKPVNAGLIVLVASETSGSGDHITLERVRKELADREGTKNLDNIKSDKTLLGFRLVYSDFAAKADKKLAAEDLAVKLAQAAIDSVAFCAAHGRPFMNGIRYLHDNREWGVVTEMSHAYQQAILDLTKTNSLEEAEYQAMEQAVFALKSADKRP